MNLDDLLAELIAGPLNEFTKARNAKAKAFKAAGQHQLAAEVAGLKKPPVAVWAVNQLAQRNKALLEHLRRAGEGVVRAQSGAVSGRKNAAPELRTASEALQRELETALREAGDVLRANKHAADEATLRRVQEMLRLAAVSGGETWDRLQRGALISEPRAGEDMLTAAFALGTGGSGGAATPRARESDARADRAADRAAAREAAETEQRIETEHVLRTAKIDEEAARQAAQTARRLREEADRIAADAKRAAEKARQAEKELERANARAKVSREAARKINRRG